MTKGDQIAIRNILITYCRSYKSKVFNIGRYFFILKTNDKWMQFSIKNSYLFSYAGYGYSLYLKYK